MPRLWRYDYEGIIVNYMVREQIFGNIPGRKGPHWKMPVAKRTLSYIPVTKSRKELYDEINAVRKQNCKTAKRISHSTLEQHLKRLIEEHVLIVYSKNGLKNKTLYALAARKLINYCGYLLQLMTRLAGRDRKRYDVYSFYIIEKVLRFFLSVAE